MPCDAGILHGSAYDKSLSPGLRNNPSRHTESEFKISTFSFFQTNSHGAEVLYETVREYVGDLGSAAESMSGKEAVEPGSAAERVSYYVNDSGKMPLQPPLFLQVQKHLQKAFQQLPLRLPGLHLFVTVL